MSNKVIYKSAIDGVAQGIIFFLIGAYIVTRYAQNQSLESLLIISGSCAVPPATIYFLLNMKESRNKSIAVFLLSSILWFILSVIIILIIYSSLLVGMFPLRLLNNADGILIMFATGTFALFSIVLKLVIFLTFFIVNICKARKK